MQCEKAKCTVTNFKSMFKVHQFAVNDSFVSKNCPHSCQESKSLKVPLNLGSSSAGWEVTFQEEKTIRWHRSIENGSLICHLFLENPKKRESLRKSSAPLIFYGYQKFRL